VVVKLWPSEYLPENAVYLVSVCTFYIPVPCFYISLMMATRSRNTSPC